MMQQQKVASRRRGTVSNSREAVERRKWYAALAQQNSDNPFLIDHKEIDHKHADFKTDHQHQEPQKVKVAPKPALPPDTDKWLLDLTSNASSIKKSILVCFHGEGGNALMFKKWAKELEKFQLLKVYAVTLPGRLQRRNEPPIKSISRTANSICTAILDVVEALFVNNGERLMPHTKLEVGDDNPPVSIILFGHGYLGSLLVYEVSMMMQFVSSRTKYDAIFKLSKLLISSAPTPNMLISAMFGDLKPLPEKHSDREEEDEPEEPPISVLYDLVSSKYSESSFKVLLDRMKLLGGVPKILLERNDLLRIFLPTFRYDYHIIENYAFERRRNYQQQLTKLYNRRIATLIDNGKMIAPSHRHDDNCSIDSQSMNSSPLSKSPMPFLQKGSSIASLLTATTTNTDDDGEDEDDSGEEDHYLIEYRAEETDEDRHDKKRSEWKENASNDNALTVNSSGYGKNENVGMPSRFSGQEQSGGSFKQPISNSNSGRVSREGQRGNTPNGKNSDEFVAESKSQFISSAVSISSGNLSRTSTPSIGIRPELIGNSSTPPAQKDHSIISQAMVPMAQPKSRSHTPSNAKGTHQPNLVKILPPRPQPRLRLEFPIVTMCSPEDPTITEEDILKWGDLTTCSHDHYTFDFGGSNSEYMWLAESQSLMMEILYQAVNDSLEENSNEETNPELDTNED